MTTNELRCYIPFDAITFTPGSSVCTFKKSEVIEWCKNALGYVPEIRQIGTECYAYFILSEERLVFQMRWQFEMSAAERELARWISELVENTKIK